MEALFIYNDL